MGRSFSSSDALLIERGRLDEAQVALEELARSRPDLRRVDKLESRRTNLGRTWRRLDQALWRLGKAHGGAAGLKRSMDRP